MSLVSLFKRCYITLQYFPKLKIMKKNNNKKNNNKKKNKSTVVCCFYCSELLLVVYSLSGGVDTNQAVFMYKWILSQ